MYVEVEAEVTKTTITKKDGTPYVKRTQEAHLFTGGCKYPLGFTVSLQEDQEPYKEGRYEFALSSFQRSKFGGLEVGYDMKLVPLLK